MVGYSETRNLERGSVALQELAQLFLGETGFP